MGNENSQPEYNTNNRCDSAKHRDPMGFMDFILPQDAINKSTLFLFPISFTHNLCITAKRVNDLFELFHFGLSFSCLCVKNKLTTNGKLGNEAFHRPTGEDHSRPKNDIFSVCGATQAANVPPTATPTKFGEES